ncbi:MAG TPA: hypothetical protein VFZ53_07905 [Polyangiaceae bacterium]
MRFSNFGSGLVLSFACATALTASCGSGSVKRAPSGGAGGTDEPGGSSGATTGGTGTGGTGGVPPGGGVGDACSSREPCRNGLACASDVCEPGGTLEPGSPCTIQPECQAGLNCVNGTCGPAGDGADGDGCVGDGECRAGYRCLVTGLSPKCVPQGTSDAGDPCTSTLDCYGGLTCANGTCGRGLASPWRGVTCEPPVREGEEVRAFFEVPGARGAEEGDFFRLPFPNDARRTGERVDLSGFPTPGVGILGLDPVALYVDAVQANDRAWGAFSTVYFRFSGELDIETVRLAGSLNFVDVTPGAPELGQSRGFSWYASVGRRNYICENWLGVRRPIGQPMLAGHTYAVWLTTAVLRAGAGSAAERTVRRSANLVALLDDDEPSDAVLAPIHERYAPFRAYMEAEGLDPSTVLTATVFTVDDHPATMASLAETVAELEPPTARDWTLCDDGVESPCPDRDGERACGPRTPDYDEYHALVSLPIFQEGTPPYLTPDDGGGIVVSTDPERQDVCLSLTVPAGTAPADGWPLAVTAHGTGGSFRSHVTPSLAGSLSQGGVPFAVLGIDQVVHGTRRGDSTESPDNLFFNFLNPAAARGNPLQGAADQLSLLRFAATIDGTGDMPTTVDPERIVFFGHSQGGTEGSLMLPYADGYKGAVLSGNGGSLLHALLNKTSPVNVKALLPLLVQDPSLNDRSDTGEWSPVLSLLQQWIDPADPLNFARLVSAPPDGHVAKSTFETYGLGDTYAPPVTLDNYSVAGGFAHVARVLGEVAGLSQAEAPLAGNLAMGTITLGMRQYRPADGDDGHFVVFDVPQANEDMVRFLSMAASGEVPAIGE